MKTIQKKMRLICSFLKNIFSIKNSTSHPAHSESNRNCLLSGASDKGTLDFEAYREAYSARCRWT